MSPSKGSNFPAQGVLGLCVALLTSAFVAVSILQFKWYGDLKGRYENSQTLLRQLQDDCVGNDLATIISKLMRKADHEVAKRQVARRQVAQDDPLTQMLTELMHAQEKALLAHCQNNSKLCVPGPKGQMGVKGTQGINGAKGATGPPGVKGSIGLQGPKGQRGPKGDQGIKGKQGVSGGIGVKGQQGVKGDPGVAGKTGPTGPAGAKGEMGVKGDKGDTGPAGAPGRNGTDGVKGEKGAPGVAGSKGIPGPLGPVGPPGKQLQKDCMCVKSPKITGLTSRSVYSLGQPVNLTCLASGVPAPQIKWTKLSDSACAPLTSTGSQLEISSLQPSQLGKYECTAKNLYGEAKGHAFVTTNDKNPLDCTFEQGMCSWANEKTEKSDWLLHTGSTTTAGTGPSADHTTGTQAGKYLYIESSIDSANDKADLTSLELPVSNSSSCLSFWYNMNGGSIGALSVFRKACDGSMLRAFHLTGAQGTAWHHAAINLPPFGSPYRLVLESVHGNGPVGDTAIDDIQFYNGSCKVTFQFTSPRDETIVFNEGDNITLSCDVTSSGVIQRTWHKTEGCLAAGTTSSKDIKISHARSGDEGTYVCNVTDVTGNHQPLVKTFHLIANKTGFPAEDRCDFERNSFCGWSQGTNDTFEWAAARGATGSVDTGAPYDHTLKNDKGTFLFIEASSPRIPGDSAELLSHVIPGNRSACLDFYYYMFGVDTGKLNVLLEDTCTHQRRLLWTKSGDQGQKWQSTAVTIESRFVPRDYRIILEATVGNSYHGDTSIDDITIKRGSCSLMHCDFSTDNCGWSQSTTDDFDWQRGHGGTDSTGTGPDSDHTSATATGQYLFIEGSSPRVQGEKADLVSPSIPGGQEYCFEFYYSMYGDSMGEVSVVKKMTGRNSQSVVFHETGQHGPGWNKGQVHIPAQSGPFTLTIEGTRGPDFTSDAAIDDLSLRYGPCT